MQIYDFGRLHGNKIKISERIGRPLGLVDGSQVFSTMFKYEHEGKVSYEIVLSTIGPENYREICNVTFYLVDVPGACAQVAKFLGERNIDILNSVSLSMISDVCMLWRMMVDLSYYGDPAILREEFDGLKKQKSSILSMADSMVIEVSRISERYTKGIIAPGSSVKARTVKRSQKTPIAIRGGEYEVPSEYLQALEGVKDGSPFIMVADHDSWVLSISPLKEGIDLVQFDFMIPDRPGAIFEIAGSMAAHNINLLSVKTKVLVYYDTMSLSVVADISGYQGGDIDALRTKTEVHIAKLKGKFQLVGFKRIEL
jgi:predicted amino acid-binding ACT domain protein